MIIEAFRDLDDRLETLAESLPDDEDNPIGSDAYWIRNAAARLDDLAKEICVNLLMRGSANEVHAAERAGPTSGGPIGRSAVPERVKDEID